MIPHSKEESYYILPQEICRYSAQTLGTKGKGCAVGRLLPLELRNELDEYYINGVSVAEIFDMLPKSVQSLSVNFLESLQALHDSDEYWCEDGLSELGIDYVNYIKKMFYL